MTRGVEQCVGPTTFLVYDTSKFAVVVVPRCAGSSGESLNTSERRVLKVTKVKLAMGSERQG